MSTPSSPRVPMSPDLSRRRVPRPKDKRRALRDFYGINQGEREGPVEYDALLDGPDFTISSYLVKLNEGGDVKNLLKLENQMIREIRILDGERKALVYDNYGKMISATDTIKHVTTEMQPMTKETFSPILDSITQLTNDIDRHSTAEGQADEDESDPDELLRECVTAGAARVRLLVDASVLNAARDEIEDLEKDLDILTESNRQDLQDELNLLKKAIEDQESEQKSEPTEST